MPTALITGASGGIGKAFAEELATDQMNLVLVARSEEKLQQIAQKLREKHKIHVDIIVQDLTADNGTDVIFNTVQSQGLTIDLLINNAGFGDYGDFAESDGERQLQMVRLNVMALVDLTHKFLPFMRQQRSGSIINVASIAGFLPIPYLSVYAATKAFVINFSAALWEENRHYGVRFLVLCPGPTKTEFFTEAKFPPNLASANNKLSTPSEVVRDALKALSKDDVTVVTDGWVSQVLINIARLLPIKSLLGMIAKQFKPQSKSNPNKFT
jgi:short-subunit dehydrogenase